MWFTSMDFNLLKPSDALNVSFSKTPFLMVIHHSSRDLTMTAALKNNGKIIDS